MLRGVVMKRLALRQVEAANRVGVGGICWGDTRVVYLFEQILVVPLKNRTGYA